MSRDEVVAWIFPEVAAGGFTRLDGTVQFYNRVQALLRPGMTVVDFGAGRGAAFQDDPCVYRRELRRLTGRGAKVIGLDIDPAVLSNPGVDEARVIEPDAKLPLESASVDLIVADFVFEHIADSACCAQELDRVLRPGGWICARTPNRWNYVAVAARMIPERLHASVLSRVQPARKSEDVFPAFYRMNDLRTLRRLFPTDRFRNFSYTISAEPAYVPPRPMLWRFVLTIDQFLPLALRSNILLFLQKREGVF